MILWSPTMTFGWVIKAIMAALVLLPVSGLVFGDEPVAPSIEQQPLFKAGEEGYFNYRIPSLVVTSRGTVLALCEARKKTGHDWDDVDLALRRSTDHGRTWSKMQIIADEGELTINQPCPVIDHQTGTIWLPLCRGSKPGLGNAEVLLMKSTDDGQTWSQPISIHQSVTDPSWTFVGTGPGHGIQLKSGRLLIPCWFDVTPTCGEVQSSCCIYSDDHGVTWKRGEPLTRNASDECDIVELEDGTVYLNARPRGQKQRAYAFSKDGGQSWSAVQYDPNQPEQSCDGALIRLSDSRRSDKNRVLVACPTNPDTRAHIKVRMSYDECRTWPIASEPLAHLGGYSDLAVTDDRQVLCLYETWPSYKELGENRTNLVLAKFNVEWLSGGKDTIAALGKTSSTRNDARTAVVKAPDAPSDRPFRIGVYLAADNHPQNLQLSRMMADWAGYGITTVCMRADIYLNLAPQGLHTLAKQWGIDLVVQPTLGPGPEHRRRMQELIQRVDSYQDSDAVTAWYAVDEFEGVYGSERPADTEKVWEELVSVIKDLDPKRKVIVNHDARTGSWGGRFAQLGEDESWCSVFWANHHAADFLKKTMATHRAAYSNDCPPLTFVYGAQSTNKAGSATDYEQHGISGVTLEQLKSVSTREDIADYVLTAHQLGAGGAAFFCYDGYYDFQYYTLVDERGRSVEGKMEGIRDAAQQIARSKGRSEVTLTVEDMTTQKNKLVITAVTASEGQPVEETLVQISFDGGYSWVTVPGFANNGGTVEHSYVPAGRWSMLRARCRNGQNWSLWTVWNAFPAAKPRPH